jgi:hypothetical protein
MVILDPIDRFLEDKFPEGTYMTEEEIENQKPIFIPFPGTTKKLKPKPYRGSDPEWQEFVKFSKDRPLQNRVRGLSGKTWIVK